MSDPLAPVSHLRPDGVRDVPVGAAAQHLAGARLIDVRQPEEYVGELGHIAGAELVPLATVGAAAASWPRDTPILLICRSGARSVRAALELQQVGFTAVYNLAGGMTAWNSAQLPVER